MGGKGEKNKCQCLDKLCFKAEYNDFEQPVSVWLLWWVCSEKLKLCLGAVSSSGTGKALLSGEQSPSWSRAGDQQGDLLDPTSHPQRRAGTSTWAGDWTVRDLMGNVPTGSGLTTACSKEHWWDGGLTCGYASAVLFAVINTVKFTEKWFMQNEWLDYLNLDLLDVQAVSSKISCLWIPVFCFVFCLLFVCLF